MKPIWTEETYGLWGGFILSLAIHAIIIHIFRLQFPPKPIPLRPQMFFLGAIINAPQNSPPKIQPDKNNTPNLLTPYEPKLFLRGITSHKPRFSPEINAKKSYLQDDFLKTEETQIKKTTPSKHHWETIKTLEPYQPIRLKN